MKTTKRQAQTDASSQSSLPESLLRRVQGGGNTEDPTESADVFAGPITNPLG